MPEGDRFERSFRAGWRSAYNYTRGGGASLEEIGDKLIQTLAKKLREADGVPGLPEMMQIVTDSNPQSLLHQFRDLDRIVREHNGHIHIRIAPRSPSRLQSSHHQWEPASMEMFPDNSPKEFARP